MIVGLLLLFVAIFLIQLTSSIKKEQLTAQQEKVFGNLFQKEGMRIGVEDCFHDILQEGIVLLGKQSRIWSDQPGGTLEFVEGVTGTIPEGTTTRIAYAITNEKYPLEETNSENPYPCDQFNKDQPCSYTFPDSQYGFGEIQLRKDVIEKDLLSYTQAQIGPCVEELIKSKTSSKMVIEPGTLDLQVKLENDGINVQVKYPLTLKLGDEELFHIADFDFFYDSLFKSFLDSAVTFPLQWDQKFVEFNYAQEQLTSPFFEYTSRKNIIGENCKTVASQTYFRCQRQLFNEKFNSLGISLQKQPLQNGDDLFTFTLPSSNILDEPSGTYTYQFVRQNRHPALDLINRSGCMEKGYDYLIIPDDPELGKIDITLNAKDPDEDGNENSIKEYRFDSVSALLKGGWTNSNYNGKDYFGQHLIIESSDLQDPSSKIIVFSARAFDTHNTPEHPSEDRQEIRVLIDRPMTTTFSIDIPYTFNVGTLPLQKYSNKFSDKKTFVVSQEDPFLLTITLPEKSNIEGVKQSVSFTYENKDDLADKFQWTEKDFSHSGTKTFRFSPKIEKSNFDDLTENDIINHFSIFKTLTNEGKLKLSFSAAYCADKNKGPSSQEATIQVKQCIPHYNSLHLNPYIENDKNKQYQILFEEKDKKLIATDQRDEKLSPFLTTHKCCKSDWTFAPPETICHEEKPEFGCFGGSTKAKEKNIKSQLLEKRTMTYFCSGDRGNICGGTNKDSYIYESQQTCGKTKCDSDDLECKNKNKGCDSIAPECEGLPQWSSSIGFFCGGDLGCGDKKKACKTFVVDANGDGKFGKDDICDCNIQTQTKKCRRLSDWKEGTCAQSYSGIVAPTTTPYTCQIP